MTAEPPLGRRALVIDDEESMRHFVKRALTRHGYEVVVATDGEAGLAAFAERPADVVALDLSMPGIDGLEVLRRLRALPSGGPDTIVVLMTAHGSIATAVEAIKLGAFQYVTKPFDADELALHFARGLELRDAVRENALLRERVDHRTAYGGLVGSSAAMRSVYQAIDLLDDAAVTVLITGESGTGKEFVARAIHARSRRAGAFVALPCATLQDTLADAQLFGSVPGAFTGAREKRSGVFARAHGGTLFLDEISELALPMQAKLERVLQEREFVPLGGTVAEPVDARIVAATNRDLDALVESGRFRRELFFRLDVVRMRVPPLRDRLEDLPELIAHFLGVYGGGRLEGFTDAAMWLLGDYDWPGNVRQLQNLVERATALAGEREILDVDDLPDEIRERGQRAEQKSSGVAPERLRRDVQPYQHAMAAAERRYLDDLLGKTAGNISEAARVSGLSRGHLHRKIRAHGIDSDEFR